MVKINVVVAIALVVLLPGTSTIQTALENQEMPSEKTTGFSVPSVKEVLCTYQDGTIFGMKGGGMVAVQIKAAIIEKIQAHDPFLPLRLSTIPGYAPTASVHASDKVTDDGGLSGEDINALQRQGEQEGWTFTVGENPATKYAIESLCSLFL